RREHLLARRGEHPHAVGAMVGDGEQMAAHPQRHAVDERTRPAEDTTDGPPPLAAAAAKHATLLARCQQIPLARTAPAGQARWWKAIEQRALVDRARHVERQLDRLTFTEPLQVRRRARRRVPPDVAVEQAERLLRGSAAHAVLLASGTIS